MHNGARSAESSVCSRGGTMFDNLPWFWYVFVGYFIIKLIGAGIKLHKEGHL